MNQTKKEIIGLIEAYMYVEKVKDNHTNRHYDITAVEKYIIGEEEKYIEVKPVYKHIFHGNGDDYLGKFPNKPLTLYSPDEEFELLNLLLGLK